MAWTEHVADGYVTSIDPIEQVTASPVTIRPSWGAFAQRLKSVPAWRWVLSALLAPICFLMFYPVGGWLGVEILAGFAILCAVVFPVLYFNVMRIEADAPGILIRNQVGFRRFVPRTKIAIVSVGKAWTGGLRTANYAFIVSPTGHQLGRFLLDNWNPDDFHRLANAIGLALYGRPGRSLDEFHSGKTVERTARFYAGSMVVGTIIGLALPLILLVVIVVAVLFNRHH